MPIRPEWLLIPALVLSVASFPSAQTVSPEKVMSKGDLRRLNLPAARTRHIKVGEAGRQIVKRKVAQFGRLSAGSEAEAPVCDDDSCICFGDDDCNEMFTTYCPSNDPDNGSCTGEPPICTCNIE